MMTNSNKDSNADKPFACPVPGCKKRYKNINGIKYHAKHGHKKEVRYAVLYNKELISTDWAWSHNGRSWPECVTNTRRVSCSTAENLLYPFWWWWWWLFVCVCVCVCVCVYKMIFHWCQVGIIFYSVKYTVFITKFIPQLFVYNKEVALNSYISRVANYHLLVSSGGLAVKHPALGPNGRRFEPCKRSKLFQGLISRLTTSWVADHVKWGCRLHWII